MKRFIIQIFKFTFVAIASIALLFIGSYCIMKRASFKIDDRKNILVLGSCYTETAVDEHFSRAENLAQTGTANIYSYVKLKKLLEDNPQIDTVITSFRQIELDKDPLWVMSDEFMFPKIAFNITLLGKEEFAVYTNKGSLVQSVLQMPIRNIASILSFFKTKTYTYQNLRVGGFLPLDYKLREDEMVGNDKDILDTKPDITFTTIQRLYLQKMMTLCTERGIKFFLINPPVFGGNKYFDSRLELLADCRDNYLPDAELMDYSNFEMVDTCFADITHLNRWGAAKWSEYLNAHFSDDARECGESAEHIFRYCRDK